MRPKEMIVSLSHVFPKRILVHRLLLPVLYSSSGSDQVLLMNAGTVSSTYGKGVTELLSRWNTGCDMRRTDVETHEGKLVASVLRASDYTDNLCFLGLEYLDLEVLYRCRQFSRTISVSFIIYSSFAVAANLNKFRMGVFPNPEPFPEKSSKLVILLSQLVKKLIVFVMLDLNLCQLKIFSSRHAKEDISLFSVFHIIVRSCANSWGEFRVNIACALRIWDRRRWLSLTNSSTFSGWAG